MELIDSHDASELWVQADDIVLTLHEAVKEADQADGTCEQQAYFQTLTETYCRCCQDEAEEPEKPVDPLLASYRGLEFAVLPALSRLRACQRTAGIRNIVQLSQQLSGAADATVVATVSLRTSRTARRFAHAVGAADAAVAQREQQASPTNSASGTVLLSAVEAVKVSVAG